MSARRLCAHPSCERVAPNGNHQGRRDRYCTLHDGLRYGPGVCTCWFAVADGVGQCVLCWHPVVSLHPALSPLAERYPWFTEQRVMERGDLAPSSWVAGPRRTPPPLPRTPSLTHSQLAAPARLVAPLAPNVSREAPMTVRERHTITIGNSFLSDDYEVTCSCGFEVTLGTHEAAMDTANWHQGKPSLLGDISGIAWEPES